MGKLIDVLRLMLISVLSIPDTTIAVDKFGGIIVQQHLLCTTLLIILQF